MRILAVYSALCLIILSGCTPPWEKPPEVAPGSVDSPQKVGSGPGINPLSSETVSSPEALEVIGRGFGRYKSINTFQASAKMKIVDTPNKFTLRCSAQIIINRPDTMRLSATKGLGMEILDLSMLGEALDVWLPRKRELYRGKTSELSSAGVNFHPQSIVEQILLSPLPYLNLPWHISTDENEGKKILTELDGGSEYNRLIFDSKTGLLLERQILSSEGVTLLKAVFSSHRQWGGSEELFPGRIQISFPQESRSILIVLKDTMINPDLKPGDFWLRVPSEDITVSRFGPSEPHRGRELIDSLSESSETE